MARIPILRDPGQLQTGNLTLRTPELPAVTNQAIAKGLGDVASVAMDISEKAKRAQDVTNLTTASMEMQKAQMEFADFQLKNPDESKWLDKWKEINTRLEGEFGSLKLTPDARLDLNQRFTTWSTRGTTMVQADAFKQTGRRAAQAVDNAIQAGFTTGDFGPAKQAVTDYNKLPLPEEDREAMRLQLASAEKKYAAESFQSEVNMARERYDGIALMNAVEKASAAGALPPNKRAEFEDEAKRLEAVGTVRQIADVDPIVAKAKLKAGEFPELTPDEKMRMESYSEGVLRDFQQRETASFADFVVNGGKADDFKFQWNLSDATQAKLREAAKVTPIMSEDQAAALRLELEARIGKYDQDKDPDRIEMVRISRDLDAYKTAVPYMASDLAMQWGAKKSGEKSENYQQMDIADHDDYVSKLYTPQLKALTGDDGAIIKGKEAEYRRLLQEATELKKAYRRQLNDKTTPKDAKKLSQDVLSVPIADRVANYFDMMDSVDAPNPLLPSPFAQPKPLNP